MRFAIKEYTLGKKIFSLAFHQNVLDELLEKNLNVTLVSGKKITFYPEEKVFELSDDNCEK